MLDDAARTEIRAALTGTAPGERGQVVRALAHRYGVSRATIYRAARLGGPKRGRAANRPEYRAWVQAAVTLAHRSPLPVPLDLALRAAVDGGLVPAEAARMPVSTSHRIARELGLRPPPRRTQRLHADYPQQALQFDASTSASLTVGQQLAEDDWQLHLHRASTPASGYKNKPLSEHRMRLVVYGVWDMCTGYRRAVYQVARGESAVDAVSALCALLASTGDPARPMHGLPDDLWSDQGPLWKARVSRELLDRLNIGLVTGEAYRKERMGGIERSWRTQWARFERSLFLADQDQWTLSAINARLLGYEREENARRAARVAVAGRTVSRTDAWAALVRARPRPLLSMPAEAARTLHRQAPRRIDRNGLVRWEGKEYECRQWHDCWVTARQSLADPDHLVLENPAGERVTARLYAPRRYGEVRGIPDTALQRLLEAGPLPGGADPYGQQPAAADPNIVPLRPRTAAVATLPDPLDTSHYPDLAAAMAAFTSLYPSPLSAADLVALTTHLEHTGLSRTAVVDLASELLGELPRQGDRV